MVLRQTLPPSAEAYAADRRLEIQAAISAVRRQWRRMGPDFDATYDLIEPDLLWISDTAQARVAALGSAYIPVALAETGQSRAVAPRFVVDVDSLIGTAGDGLPTEGLLYGAVTHARERVRAGVSVTEALASSSSWLSTAMGTLLSDTGRSAERLQTMARPVSGWVRMLNPPSCGRCVSLAGKWQRSAVTFQRHPKCFPAGVVVSGPATEAATRRWYEGELVVIRTALGKELTATGNHPVLTDQGWVPANLLNVGDRVVGGTLADGALPLVVPDEKQRPARIEDVWGADGVVALGQMPTSPEDFHGDGGHGEVDVVLPDRPLWNGRQAALYETLEEVALAGRPDSSVGFERSGSGEQMAVSLGYASDSVVGSGGLSRAFGGGHFDRSHHSGVGPSSDLDTVVHEALAQGGAAHPEALAEAVLALAGPVGVRDLGVGQHERPPRWDAPAGPLTVESRVAYARRGQDLRERLAGQVTTDRVVKVERIQWSGRVYNLTSAEGWYSANGFIVSNCDCATIPSSESIAGDFLVDGREYFDSLDEAGQIKLMGSRANAEAVRDFNGDMNQILNAYRGGGGVRSAQVYGRNVRYTTEGTTRRGIAHRRMSRAGYVQAAGEAKAGRYMRLRAPRLMPESIAQIATGRADQERLLRLYGWLG